MQEETNSTSLNLYRTILLGLCVNFNEKYMPTEEWVCDMRSDAYYQLRALNGKTIKLTTLQKLPLSGVIEGEDGKLYGTGIAFKLLHEIQKKAGFQYDLKMPDKNILGDSETGLIKLLKNKEVDMAVAFLPALTRLETLISYSSALAEFEWVLLMARPAASASQSGLLAPFQEEVWVCILVSLIVAGPTMYLIAYFRSRLERNENDPFITTTYNPYSLNACCWFVYGALMKQGSTMNPVYDSPRLFFATWWIFITILTSFYTANLTAFLTLSHFTLTIQTTHDIYKQHRHWIADQGGFEETMIYVENSFDYLKETIPKYGTFVNESRANRLKRIEKGEIYVTEKRKAKKIIALDYMNKTLNNVAEKKRCTYVIAPKSALANPMAFAYPKNSKLKPLFDPILQNFVSSGILTHLFQSTLPRSEICPLNLANGERKLLNSDLVTTYKLIFIGFISALMAFLGEIVYRFLRKKGKMNKIKTNKNAPVNNDKFRIKNNNINNIIFVNEAKTKEKLDDNFFIYEYYKEMMPYGYFDTEGYGLNKHSSKTFNKKALESKNVLYQFVH